MNENDVIKALEWMKDCKDEKISNCDGCPLLKHYPYCDELSVEIALDLINRQKAEIERLQDIIISNDEERLSSSAIMMKKEQELMHAERISGLEAEIERLKADFETLKLKYRYVDSQIPMFESEARKEFAERLKGKCSELPFVDSVSAEDIDNLLAEMESERE